MGPASYKKLVEKICKTRMEEDEQALKLYKTDLDLAEYSQAGTGVTQKEERVSARAEPLPAEGTQNHAYQKWVGQGGGQHQRRNGL